MNSPSPTPPVEFDAPILDVFATTLKMLRIVSVICALMLAGAGGVLAWNFFYFVTDIIQEPGQTVQKWQTAMAPVIQHSALAPLTPAFDTSPDRLPDSPAAAPAANTAPTAEPVPVATPETTPPVAGPTSPPAPEAVPAGEAPLPITPAPDRNTELALDFASSVLDRFQAGHFSWLLGMGFLALFCWVLGKIPGVMISAGTRVLVELLNVEKPKP